MTKLQISWDRLSGEFVQRTNPHNGAFIRAAELATNAGYDQQEADELPGSGNMSLDMSNPCASLSPDRLHKTGAKEGEGC